MKIDEIIRAIEEKAPAACAEEWDNVGLLIGNPGKEVDSVLIAFEMTEKVMQEAVDTKCGLIITHHPMIYKGLKKINSDNATGRIIQQAIHHDIAIYAAHTNLDNVTGGVNSRLAEKLGIENLTVLEPRQNQLLKLVVFVPHAQAAQVRDALFAAGAGHIGHYDSCSFSCAGEGSFKGDETTNPFAGKKDVLHFEEEARIETILPAYLYRRTLSALLEAHPYEEPAYDFYKLENSAQNIGSGMIGILPEAMEEIDFMRHVKKTLGIPVLRHSELTEKKIRKVALCGGSGSFLLSAALAQKADVFITGDIKYHDFFIPEKRLLLIDAGHYETEQFTTSLLFDILKQKFSNFAIRISGSTTNAVNYLI
ncbi:MAG: Nif3-like dinuclear metal center hexameric protein [Bacteroidales bacterium]|nr:Nif3-like dinuclear metal center hexameric protein [Bacteroidales bacterium]